MITICLMVLGGFFIWILSRRLSASVKQVVNTMKEVRAGEMSAHMEMEGKNEISIIASQFNKMMKQINNQMDEIKQVSEMKKDAEIRALEARSTLISSTTPWIPSIGLPSKTGKMKSVKCSVNLPRSSGIRSAEAMTSLR